MMNSRQRSPDLARDITLIARESSAKADGDPTIEHWSAQFRELVLEIARQCYVCDIPLAEPSLIARVVDNDATLCRGGDRLAHDKLRGLVMLHVVLRRKAIQDIGLEKTGRIIRQLFRGQQSSGFASTTTPGHAARTIRVAGRDVTVVVSAPDERTAPTKVAFPNPMAFT